MNRTSQTSEKDVTSTSDYKEAKENYDKINLENQEKYQDFIDNAVNEIKNGKDNNESFDYRTDSYNNKYYNYIDNKHQCDMHIYESSGDVHYGEIVSWNNSDQNKLYFYKVGEKVYIRPMTLDININDERLAVHDEAYLKRYYENYLNKGN